MFNLWSPTPLRGSSFEHSPRSVYTGKGVTLTLGGGGALESDADPHGDVQQSVRGST